MLVSIGEAYIDKNNIVSGNAFNLVLKETKKGNSALFAGAISKDKDGRRILEILIDNCVLFDPCLCNKDKPTFYEGKNIEESCAFSIKEENIENIFTLNTDINQVYVGTKILNNSEIRNAVLNVLKKRKTEVFIDLSESNDRNTLVSFFSALPEVNFIDSIRHIHEHIQLSKNLKAEN